MAPPTTTIQDVTSFLQRMYDPSITRGLESRMSSNHSDLFHAPWRLKTHNDDDNSNTTKAPADDNVEATRARAVYPSFTYLELRRIQNNEWATDRLKQGIRLAKEGNLVKAEACYKEGLDLVPTHAALFVAYGALCANLGRTREAIDKLQHALELDSSVPNAQTYLDAIVGKKKTPPRKAGSVMRSETAIQDALMERSFLSQESNNKDAVDKRKYSLSHQENANGDDKTNERSKRKHRHKEKKRRSSHRHDDDHRSHNHHRKSRSKRKRRKRHDSDNDDDSTSDDYSNKKRPGRRHRRDSEEEEHKRGHYKKHDRPGTDETSEESNRRRRRKRHRRKSHRGSYSDSSDTSKDRELRKRKRKERRRSHKHKRSSGERLTPSRSEEPRA